MSKTATAATHCPVCTNAWMFCSCLQGGPKGDPKVLATLPAPEFSGGSVDYYKVRIQNPTTKHTLPYTAECNDIIEALGMSYAEGNAFKAIWRSCAARTLGKLKKGQDGEGLYDAQKVEFFGGRMVAQAKHRKEATNAKA